MKSIKTILFRLLCLSGLLAGAFLLLSSWGILDPAQWQEEAQPVILPAVPALGVADQRLYQGPFLYLSDPAQPIPAGTKGVVLPMKSADGKLGYVSRLPRAMDWGASSGDPDRNAAIQAVTYRDDLHTVALISCLADDLAGQDRDLALLRESGSAWRDPSGQIWLDPAKKDTLDYLAQVCREAAALGFDELLLMDLSCPREGEEETLETFCRSLQEAALDWPCLLSVAAGPGQSDTLLATFPGRVWARAEDIPRLSAFDPVVLSAVSSD
ncbi:MAG: hypothetical protein IKB65_08340 [Ruminiclostridium sp.]|nr:hypothetical protein [Ruminiclostridium sp.]